jgi:hypothetical protein
MPPLVASTMRSRSCRGRREHPTQERLDLAEPGATPVEPVHVGGVDQVHAGVERRLEEVPAP